MTHTNAESIELSAPLGSGRQFVRPVSERSCRDENMRREQSTLMTQQAETTAAVVEAAAAASAAVAAGLMCAQQTDCFGKCIGCRAKRRSNHPLLRPKMEEVDSCSSSSSGGGGGRGGRRRRAPGLVTTVLFASSTAAAAVASSVGSAVYPHSPGGYSSRSSRRRPWPRRYSFSTAFASLGIGPPSRWGARWCWSVSIVVLILIPRTVELVF